MKKINNSSFILTLTLISVFFTTSLVAQTPWVAPEEVKMNKSPIQFNSQTTEAGQTLYEKNCLMCHGDPGKNNPKPLLPVPPDFAGSKVQINTDGELFYKISEGRGLMPQFKNIIQEEDRWKLVSFIRSFNPSYKQEAGTLGEMSAFKGMQIQMTVSLDEKEKKIIVTATGIDSSKNSKPLAGLALIFGVKRYFGNLNIGEATTNAMGVAKIDYPVDLPGDSNGFVELMVVPKNKTIKAEATMKVKIGKAVIPVNIFEKRVMWSTNDRTQLWVIISYLGVVVGVWLTILWVVHQIILISKAGKKNTQES